jgi:hypothetical protein
MLRSKTHTNSFYAAKRTQTPVTQENALYATKLTLRILRGAPNGYAALRMHIHLNTPNTLRNRMLVTHINSS